MMSKRGDFYIPVFIVFLALLSYGRLYLFHNAAWDDNCWLISAYSSGSPGEFINMGFAQMRRIPQGAFLYYLFNLHKVSDHAYMIWHSAAIFIEVVSAAFIYIFIRGLSGKSRLLAFLAAGCFLASPLDSSMPVYANLYYRLGVCLSVISFYLTYRAFTGSGRLRFLSAALGISAVAYLLMEGTVALEPARFILICRLLALDTGSWRRSLKKAMTAWSPFLLLCAPLVVYKLKFSPYGIYEGAYAGNFSGMLNLAKYPQALKYLLFQSWYIFARHFPSVNGWSVLLGVTAGILSFYALRRIIIAEQRKDDGGWFGFSMLFGSVLLVFPMIMYLYVGNAGAPGSSSRHGIILQFGWSVLAAAFLYLIFRASAGSNIRARLYRVFLASFFGLGVFFNNVNLDLYFRGWQEESRFFQAFRERFPALPPEAMFFADAQAAIPFFNMENGYFYADLNNYYDFEFPLNLLYAASGQPESFRRYKVCTAAELKKRRLPGGPDDGRLRRLSHWGEDAFDFRKLIFIHYREGELLVNREILLKYPDVPYRRWLDKGLPELPAVSFYPLRHKFEGRL